MTLPTDSAWALWLAATGLLVALWIVGSAALDALQTRFNQHHHNPDPKDAP